MQKSLESCHELPSAIPAILKTSTVLTDLQVGISFMPCSSPIMSANHVSLSMSVISFYLVMLLLSAANVLLKACNVMHVLF